MNQEAKPARVLQMIARLNVGGPALVACLQTARLSPDKFTAWLMCGRPEDNEREDIELITRMGISPLYVDHFARSVGIARDVKAFRCLRASVRQIDPDIVH